MTLATKTSVNDLKSIIQGTQEAIRANPEMGKVTFKSACTSMEGFRTEATIRDHKLTADFSEALGGHNAGPSPVELVLASIGTCQAMTYRAYATAMDIPLDEIEVEVEGDIDLRGFLAVDDSVRPGFGALRVKVRLVSDASIDQIEMLRTASDAHCPLRDIVANTVPVELKVEQQSK
jgi:putative redox protein